MIIEIKCNMGAIRLEARFSMERLKASEFRQGAVCELYFAFEGRRHDVFLPESILIICAVDNEVACDLSTTGTNSTVDG